MDLENPSIGLATKNTLVTMKMTYTMVGAKRWAGMGGSFIRANLWGAKRRAERG